MKKLITILLATLFICTASYGATIKELLGGKKSLKLFCIFSNYFEEDEYLKKKYFPQIIGKEFLIEIKKNTLLIDDFHPLGLVINYIGENTFYNYAKSNDSLIIKKDRIYYSSNQDVSKHKKGDFAQNVYITINRYNGDFEYKRVGLNFGEGNLGKSTNWHGSCEKAKENKF